MTGMLVGFVRSYTPSSKKLRKELLQECDQMWHSIDRQELFRILNYFKMRGLIKEIQRSDQKTTIALTQKGYIYGMKRQLPFLEIKKQERWDKKWRVVIFDIPEEKKNARDALRRMLKKLGFVELQKSVFIFPYPCEKEIAMVVQYFCAQSYIHYLESTVKDDTNIKKFFQLS